MQYTITVAEDPQIPGMTEFKAARGDTELIKFSSLNVRESLRHLADYIADDVSPTAAHAEDCDYIKSICERDDRHRRVPVRACDCPAKEDAKCQ